MASRTVLSSLLLAGLTSLAAPAFGQEAAPSANSRMTSDSALAVSGAGDAAMANARANTMLAASASLTQDVSARDSLLATTESAAAAAAQGDTAIAGALADAMLQAGAAANARIALATVNDLRAQGMGWGEVAQRLGFSLGEQASVVRSGSQSLAVLANAEANQAARVDDVVATANGVVGAATTVAALAAANTSAVANADISVGVSAAADGRADSRAGGSAAIRGRALTDAPVRVLRPERIQLPLRGL